MCPRDAWLLEKLDEMRAQRKATAFGRRFKPRKRFVPSKHSGLPTRLEFPREVKP